MLTNTTVNLNVTSQEITKHRQPEKKSDFVSKAVGSKPRRRRDSLVLDSKSADQVSLNTR